MYKPSFHNLSLIWRVILGDAEVYLDSLKRMLSRPGYHEVWYIEVWFTKFYPKNCCRHQYYALIRFPVDSKCVFLKEFKLSKNTSLSYDIYHGRNKWQNKTIMNYNLISHCVLLINDFKFSYIPHCQNSTKNLANMQQYLESY